MAELKIISSYWW